MAISTAVNTANLANKAAQIGYAQNVAAPKETRRTEEPRHVRHLDEEGLETDNLVCDYVESQKLEDASGVNRQRTDAIRRDEAGRRETQTGRQTTTTSTAQAERSAQSRGEALVGREGRAQPEDVGARTLRLALSDNSRQLQAQFDSQQTPDAQQQSSVGPDARRTVMLRNLQGMVNTQLAQFTGNEPYTRSNYRQILGALTQMQGGGSTSKTQGRDSDDTGAWEGAEADEGDGTYNLYSRQAAQVLGFLALAPQRPPGDEPLELVA